jgi:predicted ABC-type ATPase
MLAAAGREFFNPDVATREFLETVPGMRREEANERAWKAGLRLLDLSIAHRSDFAFETTLGGNTMTERLGKAADRGIEVRVWYVGLESVEMHVERVRLRVAQGGHDIPETKIRERYDRSRHNLIRLLPKLTELKVFDNSAESDPHKGQPPEPKLLLHWRRGRIVSSHNLLQIPAWAKPILQAAIEAQK